MIGLLLSSVATANVFVGYQVQVIGKLILEQQVVKLMLADTLME
jgi:hypothetical protein